MTEAEKDALLVRAALDIMAMQSHIALLENELNATTFEFIRYQSAVQRAARCETRGRKPAMHELSLDGTIRRRVVDAYRECEGNVERTAKLLRAHRSRIYRLLPINIRMERKRSEQARKVKTCSVR